MDSSDTISAISTVVAPGARIIVRISGPDAHRITREITDVKEAAGGSATSALIRPGCKGWVYWFAAPHSYTGEDLVELHLPGSPVLARMVLEESIRLGARQAQPGEFTARAYFNGRIDLTQAEGVAATIAAHSRREMLAARQLLAGELARRLSPIMDDLAHTLALIEVGIDFSDEDVTFLSGPQILTSLRSATAALDAMLNDSARFERLAHEPRIVLIGRPNAGKSTLLNALAGHARAVVSEIAGTTRDALSAQVRLKRGMVHIIDVAGVEDADAEPPDDLETFSIATQMRHRAMQELESADLVILVHATDDARPMLSLPRAHDLLVCTKIDANPGFIFAAPTVGAPNPDSQPPATVAQPLIVSAKTGQNLEELRDRLDLFAFGPESPVATLALNTRHVADIQLARSALKRGEEMSFNTPEVVAMEFREALDALGGILGKISPDDLLSRIFSQFCIGK